MNHEDRYLQLDDMRKKSDFFALFNTDRVTLEDKLEHFNGKVIKWHMCKNGKKC